MSNDSKPGYLHEHPYRLGLLDGAIRVAIIDLEADNVDDALKTLRSALAQERALCNEHLVSVGLSPEPDEEAEARKRISNSINSADPRHEGL